jgi:hypothetical protein
VQALLLYCKNFQFESTLYVGGPLAMLGKIFLLSDLPALCFSSACRLVRPLRADEAKHHMPGLVRCLAESASTKSLHSVGVAFTFAFTFYMVIFHSLSNLPLDQALYFEV